LTNVLSLCGCVFIYVFTVLAKLENVFIVITVFFILLYFNSVNMNKASPAREQILVLDPSQELKFKGLLCNNTVTLLTTPLHLDSRPHH